MATMNKKRPSTRTVNKSGHAAYASTGKELLVTQTLTTFFNEQKFYGDNSKEIIANAEAMAASDPYFVAKLAIYARTQLNMRTISHVLCAILANVYKEENPQGTLASDLELEKGLVRRLIPAVVVRGDDVTSILAAYIELYGKPVPNSLRRGCADAMARFNAYTVAKYQEKGKAVTMADAIKICHPKANFENNKTYLDVSKLNDAFKACLDGTLKMPESWETELSAHGNNKETWEKLIAENKVGYMAALRNLRNMVNASPDNLNLVLDKLVDPEQVAKSRQLPFRFHSAYAMMQDVSGAGSKVLGTIEKALELSIANLKPLPGRSIIAIDTSGSMTFGSISAKSRVKPAEIATLLGIIAAKISDDAIVYTFDTRLEKHNISPNNTVLSQMRGMYGNGGGTDMGLPFERAIQDKVSCDRFIVLSDNEVNSGWHGGSKTIQGLADRYRSAMNVDCWVHAIDLQGYGTQQFKGGRTNIIAGWSEKILDFISLVESGERGIIGAIEQIEV